ncbi:MAG: hypothetical protein IKC87_07305 [Clostridia bacterium]|nr:hypothetical protein [Clostridia bacterium]
MKDKSTYPMGEGVIREGDLYKVVSTYGKSFELRYGYYEECDRQSPICEPVVIYPDFQSEPVYTDGGEPFVTLMQDACVHYKGDAELCEDTSCAECRFFKSGEEWFGICTAYENRFKE